MERLIHSSSDADAVQCRLETGLNFPAFRSAMRWVEGAGGGTGFFVLFFVWTSALSKSLSGSDVGGLASSFELITLEGRPNLGLSAGMMVVSFAK